MKILVTGGAGYIGSHTCVELIAVGYDLVIIDNLCNSSSESINRIKNITGKSVDFIKGDIRDRELLRTAFEQFSIDAVIHFAGLKAVGESVARPLRYYNNNVSGSVALFEVMAEFGCSKIVFSSSATVYGETASVPIKECFPLSTNNPYGASKLMVENILNDVSKSDPTWSIALLRYFNPIGAHESGLIGEDPNGIPNNLLPYISQVAVGLREKLLVFGGDYDTVDGTGVRDYVHVVDLAKGHVAALEKLKQSPGLVAVNLGTGRGCSVLEMVKAFEQASGKAVPYEVVARRSGDVAQSYADPNMAFEVLDWNAELSIKQMCEDAWRWQSLNPKGYQH